MYLFPILAVNYCLLLGARLVFEAWVLCLPDPAQILGQVSSWGWDGDSLRVSTILPPAHCSGWSLVGKFPP